MRRPQPRRPSLHPIRMEKGRATWARPFSYSRHEVRSVTP
nr:hypothetical protein [Kibdelosporangium sp. MJ126-NF4]CTQ97406.1 hypothetical protein [Kibdelosporangium sp. MJ126-NF4]